jgi:hypothetical protein
MNINNSIPSIISDGRSKPNNAISKYYIEEAKSSAGSYLINLNYNELLPQLLLPALV